MAHVEAYRLRNGSKRYRARWLGADGKALSRSFVLKKDAERFVQEQQRRASLGLLYRAPPETLGEFIAGWPERYALRVRASTLARVREVLPHLDVFGASGVDAIRPADAEDHVAALARRAPGRRSSRCACSSKSSRTRRSVATSSTGGVPAEGAAAGGARDALPDLARG